MSNDERRTRREHIRRARIFGHANGLRVGPGGYVRDRNHRIMCQGWIQLWHGSRVWIEQWEQEMDKELAA